MRHTSSPNIDRCLICGATAKDLFSGKVHSEFCFEESKPGLEMKNGPVREMKNGPVRLITVRYEMGPMRGVL